MPTGPEVERCPAALVANAVWIQQIATGVAEETFKGQTEDGKDKTA